MIDGIAFGLNLYPSPPVSSFSSCGHHISVLFSQLFSRCVVVKIATGSSLAHRVQPFYVITNMSVAATIKHFSDCFKHFMGSFY